MTAGRKPEQLTDVQLAELRRLRMSGASMVDVMEHFGWSDGKVMRLLKKHGLTGRVCPHCGGSVPSGRLGKRRDEAGVDR